MRRLYTDDIHKLNYTSMGSTPNTSMVLRKLPKIIYTLDQINLESSLIIFIESAIIHPQNSFFQMKS